MRINRNKFFDIQAGSGVMPDQAAYFLHDLQSKETRSEDAVIGQILIRILEGKDILKNDEDRLLSLISADLYEKGQKSNGDIPQTQNDRIDRARWLDERTRNIRLLCSALEKWLLSGDFLKIQSKYFGLLTFLVNRLAKIAEIGARDRMGDLFIPEPRAKDLATFMFRVNDFSQYPIAQSELEIMTESGNDKIASNRNKISNLEIEMDEIRKTEEYNSVEQALSVAKQKLEQHKRNNGPQIRRELVIKIDDIIQKLQTFLSVSGHSDDLNFFIGALEEYKENLVGSLIKEPTKSVDNQHVFSQIGEVLDVIDAEIGKRGTFLVAEEIKSGKRGEPEKGSTQPVVKSNMRVQGFEGLAGIRIEKPKADITAAELRELSQQLFKQFKAGANFDLLVKLTVEIEQLEKNKEDLDKLLGVNQRQGEIARLEEENEKTSSLNNKLDLIVSGWGEEVLSGLNRSLARIKEDILGKKTGQRRPGAALYLFKSIIIAMKICMNESGKKDPKELNPLTPLALALDRSYDHGRTEEIDLSDSGKGRAFQKVHYLTSHLPFAAMALAYFLRRRDDKSYVENITT